MTTERWRRLEALYQDMLSLPPKERSSALLAACPDDPVLAAEVRSLLSRSESSGGWLEGPALAAAAGALAGPPSTLTGRKLGVFEIQGLLGMGGMGEVYRGWDSRLGRAVAIKILPGAFQHDPDRVARFEREARHLASLNHPNIGSVYGLEEGEGVKALVMELVEGEDLHQRLRRGPMPVKDVISVGRQIAEGIEAAHEQGVIHRDLKPANIRIRPDGTVKVLDFGLALAMERPATGDPTESPTRTAHATRSGAILGTAAYMAPEQASGKPVDRRADVWSFGAVLYEMFTGERAFKGEDVASTLAAVLRDSPGFDRLPASVPARARRLLERCLDRDPRTRLRDIGEARIELARIEAGAPEVAGDGSRPSPGSPRRVSIALGLIAAAALGALAVLGIVRYRPMASPGSSEIRLTMPLGPALQFTGVTAYVAVSPDGRAVTFSGRTGVGVAQQSSGGGDLYSRSLDSTVTTALGQRGSAQFYSPDGEWLGFFDDGFLKKIPASGGAPATLARTLEGQGDWSEGGLIVFTEAGDRPSFGLRRVSAAGGSPVEITKLDRAAGQTHHLTPQVLPGGKRILFTIRSDGPRYQLALVGRDGGPSTIVAEDAAFGHYLGDGLLLFQRDSSLFVARFDEARPGLSGERPVLDGVLPFPTAPAWAISGGTLAYRKQEDDGRALLWVNRDGTATPLDAPRKPYWNPRLSPRGDRIAFHMFEGRESDVWTYDIGPGRLQQLTTDGFSRVPVWTPDGTRLLVNRRAAMAETIAIRLDGTGTPESLGRKGQSAGAAFLTPDGRYLVAHEIDPETGYDLMTFDLETPGPPTALVRTSKLEAGARLHPGGQWVAYASDVTGRNDVFVTRFPGGGTRLPVTVDGGREPAWSHDGRELFYRQGNRMYAVAFRPGAEPAFDTPKLLFDVPYFQGGGPGNTQYDVARDGRFLMMKAPERETPALAIIINWTDTLRKAVGKP